MEDSVLSSHNVEVPLITKEELIMITADAQGYLTLMDDKGNCREDLQLPNDTEEDLVTAKKIISGIENEKEMTVTVLSSMGIEKIYEAKER